METSSKSKLAKTPEAEMLTPSEIELLRQKAKDDSDYLRKELAKNA